MTRTSSALMPGSDKAWPAFRTSFSSQFFHALEIA
jgi:hypothetical protein